MFFSYERIILVSIFGCCLKSRRRSIVGSLSSIYLSSIRPKRPSYCAPRHVLNDNPCIMNSITEKLFPKLTLDHRYPIHATMVNQSPVMTAILPNRANIDAGSVDNVSKSSAVTTGRIAGIASECNISSAMLCSEDDSPNSSLAFAEATLDMATSSSSPPPQSRPSPILFPQLVTTKEYSQMLNELAAVL